MTVFSSRGRATHVTHRWRAAPLARAQDRHPPADVIVISGRVPTGAPVGALGELVRLASGAGRQGDVDADRPLMDALRARPTAERADTDESAELVGTGTRSAQRRLSPDRGGAPESGVSS